MMMMMKRALIAQSVKRWVSGWKIGVLGFDSRGGVGIFLFTTASVQAQRPTQPPIQWVPGSLSLRVKRPKRKADHSPNLMPSLKNEWSYTFTPPIRLHGVVLSLNKQETTLPLRRGCIWLVNATHPHIRRVAMKFPEWFYCKPHICIHTACWEVSPSKYTPWAAVHLVQWCCYCWKHFWSSVVRCGISFSAISLRQTLFLETTRSHSDPN
jgi:hypothetical protein